MSETVGPPTNNVGSGNIAGVGVGSSGEPGGKKSLFQKLVRRKIPIKESSSDETFAGNTVFPVDADRYWNARMGKRKYARWVNYVGEDDLGLAIKDFGYKYPSKPIILRNTSTGTMLFLRYPKTREN